MATKKRRAGSKAQASALENEMKCFLGARSRTTAYRTAAYRPTLEKFQSTSFSDYVRCVLMGVPLEGVEPEEPCFEAQSDTDTDMDAGGDEGGNGNDGNEDGERELNDNGDDDTVDTGSSKAPSDTGQTPTDGVRPLAIINAPEKYTNMPKNEEEKENPVMAIVDTNENIQGEHQKPESPKRMTTRRMTTRSLTASAAKRTPQLAKEKENIYSKQYFTTPSPRPERKRRFRALPLEPDKLKLTDGIAKIIPPEGWWDKAGIGKDTTARGQPWQKGSKLGDMMIPGPIKQCVAGIGGVYDFTMMELPSITVANFRNRADAYRKRQTGNAVDEDESDDHLDLLARKFWKRIGPTMESSQYGADMEGTLFDGADACGWNVNNLESCLALLEADYKNADEVAETFKLPGVTSAYLYFGMWASVFAAHTEDMNLLSINYLHAGAPKYWYAIAHEDSDRFESLMRSMFSHQNASCSEFLRHKRSLMSPSLLTKAGISYTTQVQRAGDIIITFPGSYHFGFNTGFNCAESTNFAVPEWVPTGFQANICMCHPHSVRIDMRRFKILLDKYEHDMFRSDDKSLTYTKWAKEHIRKKKKKKSNDEKEELATTKEGGRPKPIVVEVMKLSSRRGGGEKASTSKKKSKMVEIEEFRIAATIRPSQLVPQTPVLCLLDCDDDVECYFSGVIVDVVENHAKIHFAGSTRNEDIWLTIDSGKLFLNGGSPSDRGKKKKKKKGR